jgi:hypothetical protein
MKKYFAIASAIAACAVLVAMNAMAIARFAGHRAAPKVEPAAVKFRSLAEPIRIAPNAIPGLVSDEELDVVLRSVEPRFDPKILAGKIPVPLLVHASRLWGGDATFPDRAGIPALRGEFLLENLLNNDSYRTYSSIFNTNLLVKSPYGTHVVTSEDLVDAAFETMTHLGQLTKVLADSAVPSGRPIVASGGSRGTVLGILQDDAARLRKGAELEFAVAGLCRYAAGDAAWSNRFGQRISFDLLAGYLMEGDPARPKACAGAHVPYALALLLRSHRIRPLLSAATARGVEAHLRSISATLERMQRDDGAWDLQWSGADHPPAGLSDEQGPAYQRLVGSGHTLEWIAFAPEDCRPRVEVIRRAARSVVGSWPEFVKLYEEDWHNYMPLSHAARAIWMISGKNLPAYAGEKGDGKP